MKCASDGGVCRNRIADELYENQTHEKEKNTEEKN